MPNIFEQPWTLLIAAAALAIAVTVAYPFLQAKSRRRLWLIPLLVAGAAPLLDFAVQTDREKIKKVIAGGVKAVENEAPRTIALLLSNNYKDSAHPSKDAIIQRFGNLLTPPLVEKIYYSILEMQISGDTASVILLNRIFFDPKSDLAEFTRLIVVEVQIDLQKTPAQNWLITGTEILRINNQPAQWTNVNYETW